jgi:hypothetical protein
VAVSAGRNEPRESHSAGPSRRYSKQVCALTTENTTHSRIPTSAIRSVGKKGKISLSKIAHMQPKVSRYCLPSAERPFFRVASQNAISGTHHVN